MKTVEQSYIELGRKDGEYRNRGSSIYAKCLDCCAYSQADVNACPSTACWLWPYRNRKTSRATLAVMHPDRKPRTMNPAAAAALAAYHQRRELAQ